QHHGDEGQRDADGQRQDWQHRAAQVQKEQHDDDADHDRLLGERVLQRVDRPLDEAGAVVRDRQLDPVGEAGPELLDLLLDPTYAAQGVPPIAGDPPRADRLALAVPLEQPAPDVGPEAHGGDVPDQQWRPAGSAGAQRDLFDRAQVVDVAP